MRALLRDIIEHHVWANETLFRFCASLAPEQMALAVPGTLGAVGTTLVHIVEAEQSYLSHIPDTGIAPTFNDEDPVLPPVSDLIEAIRRNGDAWRAVIERWPENLEIDYVNRRGIAQHRSVGFFVTQMLDHASEHRNQVRTTLSAHGIEPPDIDAWRWDNETGAA